MKICSRCKNSKSLTEFYKQKSSKDGKHSICKICNKIEAMIWYKTNRDRAKNNASLWYVSNQQKHKIRMSHWRKTNSNKHNAIQAKRRATKLQATPNWLTKIQLEDIQEFYDLAKKLQWLSDPNDPLEVDHIIPLQGENICGLHVPWNLQILPKSLNGIKSNKF